MPDTPTQPVEVVISWGEANRAYLKSDDWVADALYWLAALREQRERLRAVARLAKGKEPGLLAALDALQPGDLDP